MRQNHVVFDWLKVEFFGDFVEKEVAGSVFWNCESRFWFADNFSGFCEKKNGNDYAHCILESNLCLVSSM